MVKKKQILDFELKFNSQMDVGTTCWLFLFSFL